MKLLLLIAALLGPGDAFLEPLQQRDSILVGDQLRYGVVLEDVAEDTPLALPEFQLEKNAPLEILGSWQLDSTRVSKRKESPARYRIKASLLVTAFDGGLYELPDIPVLLGADTLVFHAPEPLEVKEPAIDMESFQPNDIKPQVQFPYTFKEVFPWVAGGLAFCALLTLLVLWLLKRRKAAAQAQIAEPAHIRALRKLDKYRGEKYWKPEQQKGFYSGVTDALREYIDARYGVGAMEMTTAEIFGDLRKTDIPADLYEELKDLFERADFVKFAKYTASEQENKQVLPLAVRFVTTTYQAQLEAEIPSETKEEE